MKLIHVRINSAGACGGLLDGFDLWLRGTEINSSAFDPLCLIGPNGTGKSQFLQALVEAFQLAFLACVPEEEYANKFPDLLFEIEYLIRPQGAEQHVHVRIVRQIIRRQINFTIQRNVDNEWVDCPITHSDTIALLPKRIIGYTSGNNETLSLPFLMSRSGYAMKVGTQALKDDDDSRIPETRLLMIDYGTNLEVLVANLLLGEINQRRVLLDIARLHDLHSFRCIIQLAHSAAPKLPLRNNIARKRKAIQRKGIQLTNELENYIEQLKRCSTCYDYDEKNERYTFDFYVTDETRAAFRHYWQEGALELYSSFHKLAMLNDLALPKESRALFVKKNNTHFSSRLPEPQEQDKVFRFDNVCFAAQNTGKVVDYVSLSDGEHQLAQILGTFCMISDENVLFLLDEPESHFNPLWRIKFISSLLDVPTKNGMRRDKGAPITEQDCLLTTHAPFVPSDMPRDKVLIFSKDEERSRITVQRPKIETYGTTFDDILDECFGVRPPISAVAHQEIEILKESADIIEIQDGIDRLGFSVEKVFLVDKLRELTSQGDV
ncbi:MAG TPA: restriction system-associated AAA family ATPase [Armatimonadota bacterium]|nr:restriction system-associated AAA family ATPase [Armatimonadota bacterium]